MLAGEAESEGDNPKKGDLKLVYALAEFFTCGDFKKKKRCY